LSASLKLPNKLSIDSGVILSYFLGEELGKLVKSNLLPPRGKTIYCNRLCVSELFYVLCRRRGEAFAHESVGAFLGTGYASMVSSDELDMEAGAHKCRRTLSLADCYVLALAKIRGGAALFARREEDVREEIRKRPFDIEVIFLEDLV
jgi:predicted nucleic acid-binding protein